MKTTAKTNNRIRISIIIFLCLLSALSIIGASLSVRLSTQCWGGVESFSSDWAAVASLSTISIVLSLISFIIQITFLGFFIAVIFTNAHNALITTIIVLTTFACETQLISSICAFFLDGFNLPIDGSETSNINIAAPAIMICGVIASIIVFRLFKKQQKLLLK